jgi:hypothetical protein
MGIEPFDSNYTVGARPVLRNKELGDIAGHGGLIQANAITWGKLAHL